MHSSLPSPEREKSLFRFDVVGEYRSLLAEDAGMTLKLTVACVFSGVILGMARTTVASGERSRN